MPKNSNRIFLSSAKTEAKLCLQGLQYFPDVQICLWLITTEYAKYVGIYYETSIISDSCHLGYMALCVLMEAEHFFVDSSPWTHDLKLLSASFALFYMHLKEAMQCYRISLFNSLMKAQSQHEIRTDSMYFLNVCSCSHCEWFIGAC